MVRESPLRYARVFRAVLESPYVMRACFMWFVNRPIRYACLFRAVLKSPETKLVIIINFCAISTILKSNPYSTASLFSRQPYCFHLPQKCARLSSRCHRMRNNLCFRPWTKSHCSTFLPHRSDENVPRT